MVPSRQLRLLKNLQYSDRCTTITWFDSISSHIFVCVFGALNHLFFSHPDAQLLQAQGGNGMTSPPNILSVGTNPVLMASRSLILRGAGYLVEEAYSVDKAINVVEGDFPDAVLICHTVP